jgi:hypothetical protein
MTIDFVNAVINAQEGLTMTYIVLLICVTMALGCTVLGVGAIVLQPPKANKHAKA